MAARKLKVEDLKRIEQLAKGGGKIIVRQQWGEQGPGLVDLTQMEEVAMAAVCALLAGTLDVVRRWLMTARPKWPLAQVTRYMGLFFYVSLFSRVILI